MVNRSYGLSPADRRQSNQPFWQRFFMSQRFLAIVFLLIIVAISFPLVRSTSQRKMIEQEISDIKKDNEAYRNKSQDLKNMIDYLQSDISLEEQARLNLGLKKPNEAVIVINQVKSTEVASSTVPEESRVTNWRLWLHYFFK
ncbi:MAG: septum formation initiator family protein [Candidatus Falkowbacteria bacterium]